MSSGDIAIKVHSVSKHFVLPHQKARTLKSFFLNPFTKYDNEKQMALDGVSFEIKKGEFFGIVGRNGSGKSTLLKCMAGVYTPDKGQVKVDGTLVPFIELGVGFNPELSGRDNVYLNGSLLGFSRNEIEGMYDKIVEFSELEKFMDQKLKNYSSGMQVRLAFSIAIQAKGDILLLDEVLAVGDSSFQRKCYGYFEKLKEENATVVLVSHSMDSVERFCDKALLLDSGEIKQIGTASKISQLYSDVNVVAGFNKIGTAAGASSYKSTSVEVKVEVSDQSGGELKALQPDQKLKIKATICSKEALGDTTLGIIVSNSKKIPVFASNTKNDKKTINIGLDAKKKVEYEVDNIFSNDIYTITLSLKSKDGLQVFYKDTLAARFVSVGRSHTYAIVSPAYKLKVS